MDVELSQPIQGRVVVTGASGFIGGRLRDALLAHDVEVVSLVRAVSPSAKKGRSAAVDYQDVDSLRELFKRERPDYVFHVAGATKGVRYDDFHLGNVTPTQNLVQALLDVHPDVKRFVHVSSGASYGPSNAGPPKRESDERAPIEHYGKSKLASELAVEAAGTRLQWTIVRPAIVYGPGEADMFNLFKAAANRINLFYGNRDKRCSCIYIDDLLDGMVAAANNDVTAGRGYFLCDGVVYTWGEIQAHIARAVGKRALDVHLPSMVVGLSGRFGEALTAFDKKPRLLNRQKALLDAQIAWLFSNEAARQDFGFQAGVSMEEGTRRTYRWYVDNRWL
jgi:nucleoside-diphosphate-sugar epimerase